MASKKPTTTTQPAKTRKIKKEPVSTAPDTTPVQVTTPTPVKKTRLVKGSVEAKELMAKLRAMKKPKSKPTEVVSSVLIE